MQDTLFERAFSARANVFDRHALLQRRDAYNRTQRAVILWRTAVDNARFVEMDVGLDQASARQAALGIVHLGDRIQPGRYRGDTAALNADIHRLMVVRTIGKPGIADYEIHPFSLLYRKLYT